VVDPVAYLPQLKDRALRVQQIMDEPDTPLAARDRIGRGHAAGQLVQFKDKGRASGIVEGNRLVGMDCISVWDQASVPASARPQPRCPNLSGAPGDQNSSCFDALRIGCFIEFHIAPFWLLPRRWPSPL